MQFSLMQCNKKYIEEMLTNSYPKNRVNSVIEFSFCSSTGYDGTELTTLRRNGLIGWFQISAQNADAFASCNCIRYDEEGNEVNVRFDDLNSVANNPNVHWFFGYFHKIIFETNDRAALMFIGWQTNEELYEVGTPPPLAGFQLTFDLDAAPLGVANKLGDETFISNVNILAVGVSDADMISPADTFGIAIALPQLGGNTVNNDYLLSANATFDLGTVTVAGGNWNLLIRNVGSVVGDETIDITSATINPLFHVENSVAGETIQGCQFGAESFINDAGDPLPISNGQAGDFHVADGGVNTLIVNVVGVIGCNVTVTDSNGAAQTQACAGAAVLNFPLVFANSVTPVNISLHA